MWPPACAATASAASTAPSVSTLIANATAAERAGLDDILNRRVPGEVVDAPDGEDAARGVKEADVTLDGCARLPEAESLVETAGSGHVAHAERHQADNGRNSHARTV